MAKLAALAALASLPGLRAGSCPKMDAYIEEASPFGWPMTPRFSYDHQECWSSQYAFCDGLNQSPMDLNLLDQSHSCETENAGADGALKDASSYWTDGEVSSADWTAMGLPPKPVVKVSGSLRSVFAEGPFGSLRLQDAAGEAAVYDATQVHITPHSLHSINSASYDAEMMVMHHPRGTKDFLSGSVIVSVLFRVSNSSSSPIFDRMGADASKGKEWTVDTFGLADTLNPALLGPSLLYNGSVPVPPCSETVTWIVLEAAQPISQAHLDHLKEVLSKHAGGWQKRGIKSRHVGGGCRKIVKNGLKVSPVHEEASCAAMPQIEGGKKRPLTCTEDMHCMINPDIKDTTATMASGVNAGEIMHYTPQAHVTMVPTNYTLEAHVDHGGNFGHLMLNGKMFVATKVAVKAVASHTINGVRYDGELLISHKAYGAGGGHSSSEPAHGAADHGDAHHGGAQHGAGHRRLAHHEGKGGETYVIVSVPLKLGKESPLLRHLGLGRPEVQRAIRDGNSYELHQALDLEEDLAPALQGNWYWYTAGEAHHECTGEWRWLVFATPLEVSFEQLNDLSLPVSGMDSTWTSALAPAQLWKDSLPAHAVSGSSGHGVCSQPWSYQNAHCWSTNFSMCSGDRQSPINIKAADVSELGDQNFLAHCSWKPVRGLDVENNGKMLQVANNQLGYFAYVDEEGNQAYYQVTGMKLHMPSEHMIDNKQFDAELQIVHQKQKAVNELLEDDLAIASFLFRVGEEESPLLKQFHLPGHLVQEGAPTKMSQPLDLMRALGPALDSNYYRYDGSITVPDCSQDAKWFVFDTPLSMSQAQVDAFKQLFPGGNNRPVQALNGRTIAKDSFMEGTLKQYEFYLNRKGGRNRSDWGRSETLILIPIIFSIVFTIYIMASVFVREDKARSLESAGGLSGGVRGLEQSIGRERKPYAQL